MTTLTHPDLTQGRLDEEWDTTTATESVSYTPPVEPPSLDEAFEAFHAEHPHVYARLHTLAMGLVAAGHRRIGVKMLWETLRYHTMLEAPDPSGAGWKLNNSYTSRYARLLLANEPLLADVIETRGLHS